MIDQRVPQPHEGDVKELRLALVCYGGVSLAIYMHGTTKELHRLIKASALADKGLEAETPTERVYQRVLDFMQDRDTGSVRTRVVVDVIAGTSAGGINGVYLAKALAHNRSQDGLRDVWLQRGDIAQLLDFDDAKSNFFAAARYDLQAQLTWIDKKAVSAAALVRDQLLRIGKIDPVMAGKPMRRTTHSHVHFLRAGFAQVHNARTRRRAAHD